MNGAPLGQHMAPPKRDLGRSLFLLPVDSIRPNPDQPRRTFGREELQELTISIAQVGLIQPLTVRRSGAGYELISGERRLRACELLGLKEVPCIVEEASPEQSALMALVENVQRADLSFWEEAEGYRRLLAVYGLNREELCRRIGKSPAFLSNKLRLLRLSPAVRAAAEQGALSERHARCLLSLDTEAEQLGLKNVVFFGRRPLEEMPGLYAQADAMLVTLRSDKALSLTLPGKVQSYMAAGKPVIGAIDGETQEVILAARCGFCARAEDAQALADCIRRFVDSNEKVEMGRIAREYSEAHFEKALFMDRLEEEMKETIRSSSVIL